MPCHTRILPASQLSFLDQVRRRRIANPRAVIGRASLARSTVSRDVVVPRTRQQLQDLSGHSVSSVLLLPHLGRGMALVGTDCWG
jgi:hypothetical protein